MTDGHPFKKFIAEMKFCHYAEFRRRVVFECAISDQTFRNWQRGIYEPEESSKATIDRIAFEVTGRYIYQEQQ